MGQTTTKTGTTVGTVAYMSPEQARGEQADARSDIFSLGAVLYEMLTGVLPFPGEHEVAVLYGIMNSDPKPLQEYLSEVPQDLQRLMDKVLKKDPRGRHQGVLQLREELKALIQAAADAGEGSSGASVQAGRAVRHTGSGGSALASAAAPHALAVMDFRDLTTPDDPTVSAGSRSSSPPHREQSCWMIVRLHSRPPPSVGSASPIEEDQMAAVAWQAGATLFRRPHRQTGRVSVRDMADGRRLTGEHRGGAGGGKAAELAD
jgi:serine/threonine protein kinase